MRRFYLGTHRLSWLPRTDVPLFVSAVQLRGRRTFHRARGPVAYDSGGFSQLQAHDGWTGDDAGYAGEVRVWAEEVGMPDFAAIRDWMCEPFMLEKTGKTIADHQALTIESLINLRATAPEIPWMPVLQGWEADDYLDHVEQYAAAGVDLVAEPIVGVGSICRRQGTRQAARIIRAVALQRIRIHAFGVKSDGLRLFGDFIESADSMAWSFKARRQQIKLDGCVGHKNCANCLRWALEWRQSRIVDSVSSRQGELDLGDGHHNGNPTTSAADSSSGDHPARKGKMIAPETK